MSDIESESELADSEFEISDSGSDFSDDEDEFLPQEESEEYDSEASDDFQYEMQVEDELAQRELDSLMSKDKKIKYSVDPPPPGRPPVSYARKGKKL